MKKGMIASQATPAKVSTNKPGGSVDLSVYPKSLAQETPQALATVKLPG